MAQRSLKILFCVWGGWGNNESPYQSAFVSGDRIGSRKVAEGLAKRGHDVHFFSLANENKDTKVAGVTVRFRKNPHRLSTRERDRLSGAELFSKYFQAFVDGLNELCRKESFDLLMARTVFPTASGAALVAQGRKIPLVTTVAERDFLSFFAAKGFPPKVPASLTNGRVVHHAQHTFHLASESTCRAEFQGYVRKVFESSAGIVVLDEHLIADIEQITKRHAPVAVVPDGVDIELFAKKRFKIDSDLRAYRGQTIIACVARTGPYKRQDLLLKSAARIIAEYPKVRIWIIGEGPYLDFLKKISKREGMGDRVKFWGLQSHSRIAQLLSLSSIVVCPTDTEGLPLNLLEGMAARRAVLASDIAPFDHWIQNRRTGMLAKNDVSGFTQALRYLLSHEKERQVMAERAFQKIRKFTWENSVQGTESAIRSFLN